MNAASKILGHHAALNSVYTDLLKGQSESAGHRHVQNDQKEMEKMTHCQTHNLLKVLKVL